MTHDATRAGIRASIRTAQAHAEEYRDAEAMWCISSATTEMARHDVRDPDILAALREAMSAIGE